MLQNDEYILSQEEAGWWEGYGLRQNLRIIIFNKWGSENLRKRKSGHGQYWLELLPCRHYVGSDFIYITSFNSHKTPTGKKLLSLLTVIDSEGKQARTAQCGGGKGMCLPPLSDSQAQACFFFSFLLYKWLLSVFLKVETFWYWKL